MASSINRIKASNGSSNAAVATVQNLRSSGSAPIIVDTVAGIPAYFMASMGTPHTFVDPITAETITVISEASAVDFAGHVNGANLEIDTIAPGYVDAGSKVGDIVIIRPTTQWADNVASILAASLNDDGTMKAAAVQAALGIGSEPLNGWNALGYAPNSVTALGNRSYSMVFNAVNLTDRLSTGMRLRMTRTAAAPTQCTSLNGTTQYYSKSSPAGMTFTDDFTVSAWVKLSSYSASESAIATRFNGTSGWYFYIDASGRVALIGHNAGAGNYSLVISYQSIPLNRWVHVSAQLDMSAFTATPTTSYTMINGIDVPASVIRAGTNPTALIQAGNLEIGSRNSGVAPLAGKIAQVAIYSAKVTQATILASMNQGLAGTETSLISAYSFNNTINDLNANANNLTANGSAVATNADSPFAQAATAGSLEYGIITAASFSTNTTLTVQVPEGSAIPTSGGVSAVSYATVKMPYGFPGQRGKWIILSLVRSQWVQNPATTDVWYNVGSHQLVVPIGDWNLGYNNSPIMAASTVDIFLATLSTANNSESDTEFTVESYAGVSGAAFGAPINRFRHRNMSTATIYYLNLKHHNGTGSIYLYNADTGAGMNAWPIIEAELDLV